MKKKLKSDLISLAHRILKMDAQPDYMSMQHEAKKIYDILTVLAFTDAHFDGSNPTIGKQQIFEALQDKTPEVVEEIIQESQSTAAETASDIPEFIPANDEPKLRVETNADRVNAIARANEELFQRMQEQKNKRFERMPAQPVAKENDQRILHEPVIEKIKDMVAQMPPEADQIDDMVTKITNKPEAEPRDEVADFGRLAEFEMPAHRPQTRNAASKSTKGGLNIGLNDKLAFIRHLFNGSNTDYNRIISQLNTQGSKEEALRFIETMVKPDYNYWEGKEIYENRFVQLVERQLEG